MRKSKFISRIHLREKTLLTKRDFADYLSVHVDTITRWQKMGYLPKPEDPALYPKSRVWLWKYYVIKKWLEENCVYGEIELEKEGKEMIDSLLSIKRAALLWNVSPAFIIKWYWQERKLPYLAIGQRIIRFERKSLNQFMQLMAQNPYHRRALYAGRKMRAERRISLEEEKKKKEREWLNREREERIDIRI